VVRLAVALAALAFAASACGKTTIDAGKAEKFIRSSISPLTPRSVTCPSGVEAKQGRTVKCTLVLTDGRIYTVTLHVISGARVEFTPTDVRPGP
jgi:hypothetical protein